jgi:hypothetical protein
MSDSKPAKPHGAFAETRKHEMEVEKKPQHPTEERLVKTEPKGKKRQIKGRN